MLSPWTVKRLGRSAEEVATLACDGSCVNGCAEPSVGDGARRASPGGGRGAFPPRCAARARLRAVSDCIDRLSSACDAAIWPDVGFRPRGIALLPRAFAVTFRRLAMGAPAFAVAVANADADDDEGGVGTVAIAARDGGVGVRVDAEASAAGAVGARAGGGPMGMPVAVETGSLAIPFTAASLSATPAGTLWFRETPGTTELATPMRIVVAPSLNAAAAISGGKERIASAWGAIMWYSTFARNIDTASWVGFGLPPRCSAANFAALLFASARDAGVANQQAHKQAHLQMSHWHASNTAFVSRRLGPCLAMHTGQFKQLRKAHLHVNLWTALALPFFTTFPCAHPGHVSVTSAPFTVKLSRIVFASFESALKLMSTSFCAFTFLFASVLSFLFAVVAAVAASRRDFAAFRSASSFTLSRPPLSPANKLRAFESTICAFTPS